MNRNKSLFDDDESFTPYKKKEPVQKTEVQDKKNLTPLERLRHLDDKIAKAIIKVTLLKEEKTALEQKVKALELKLKAKDQDIEKIQAEKMAIKNQVERLLNELETIEVT